MWHGLIGLIIIKFVSNRWQLLYHTHVVPFTLHLRSCSKITELWPFLIQNFILALMYSMFLWSVRLGTLQYFLILNPWVVGRSTENDFMRSCANDVCKSLVFVLLGLYLRPLIFCLWKFMKVLIKASNSKDYLFKSWAIYFFNKQCRIIPKFASYHLFDGCRRSIRNSISKLFLWQIILDAHRASLYGQSWINRLSKLKMFLETA